MPCDFAIYRPVPSDRERLLQAHSVQAYRHTLRHDRCPLCWQRSDRKLNAHAEMNVHGPPRLDDALNAFQDMAPCLPTGRFKFVTIIE